MINKIQNALMEVAIQLGHKDVNFNVTNSTGHGDLSSNIPFILGKSLKQQPFEVAKLIIAKINKEKYGIKKLEFAKPGFLNFTMQTQCKVGIIQKILKEKENFGRGNNKQYINIEFVSANPTGYLHIGHARGAVYGDVLANVLEFAGNKVDREYYVNDAGVQIQVLGITTFLRYKELFGKKIQLPKNSYGGKEIIVVAKKIKDKIGDKYLESNKENNDIIKYFANEAKKILLSIIKEHLHKFRVDIPYYFSESSLYKPTKEYKNKIMEKIANLPKQNIYEKDGATWLNTTKFGDDKDRVLIKSNGSFTYFAPDMIYHNIKASRGYDTLINIWGADHSGYVKRMEIALEISGYPNILKVPIVQMVRLIQNGQEVVMSKRKGTTYTLKDLIDEVGTDAARFLLLNRTIDSKMDFDLDLALSKKNDNPVIYVQYAFARAIQILKKANYSRENKISFSSENIFQTKYEQLILDELWKFSTLIDKISRTLKVNLLNRYIINLSKLFHSFYNNVNVINSTQKSERLILVDAISHVLRNGLKLLGINALERISYE